MSRFVPPPKKLDIQNSNRCFYPRLYGVLNCYLIQEFSHRVSALFALLPNSLKLHNLADIIDTGSRWKTSILHQACSSLRAAPVFLQLIKSIIISSSFLSQVFFFVNKFNLFDPILVRYYELIFPQLGNFLNSMGISRKFIL